MQTATATLKNYRQAPRKVRLVADLVRGKGAERALALLSTLPKRASNPMATLIKSAVANSKMSAKEVYISKIEVGGGIIFKRSMPRARGKASPIKKRTSHISIQLSKKSLDSARDKKHE